jgi:hypothetical protein
VVKLAVPLVLGEGIPVEVVFITSVTVGVVVGVGFTNVSVTVGAAEVIEASELGFEVADEVRDAEELAAPAAIAGPTSSCSPESGSVARPQVSPTLLKLRP